MSADQNNRKTAGYAAVAVQKAALIVGIVFLLVGVLGFIPGITSNYDELTFAGHGSGALLMQVFQVSVLHNIVHLLFGIAGLVLAKTIGSARVYLIGGGAIYGGLCVYGMVVGHDSVANFVPVNTADNWLHLALFVGMIALGFWLSLGQTTASARREEHLT